MAKTVVVKNAIVAMTNRVFFMTINSQFTMIILNPLTVVGGALVITGTVYLISLDGRLSIDSVLAFTTK